MKRPSAAWQLDAFLTATPVELREAFPECPAGRSLDRAQWPSQHAEWRKANGLAEEVVAAPSEPAFMRRLLPRERDIVRTFQGRFLPGPGAGELFFDISQSIHRVPVSEGVVPCICPGSRIWSLARARLLHGSELLSLQGLFHKDFPAARAGPGAGVFPHHLLCDLAGNAFLAPVFQSWLLTIPVEGAC